MRVTWRWRLRLLWRETLLPLLGIAIWLGLIYGCNLVAGPPAVCLQLYSDC
ncbi:MAG: hypothetical protein KGL26_03070 [Pseudomonadota bacterium]|nr:hypothetical protein [Pseudomonadota bacterium]